MHANMHVIMHVINLTNLTCDHAHIKQYELRLELKHAGDQARQSTEGAVVNLLCKVR